MSEFVPNGYFVDKTGKRIEVTDATARSAAAAAKSVADVAAGSAASAMAKAEENAESITALTKEMAFKPDAYGLPMLYLTGDTTGMTKDNAVDLAYEYEGRTGVASVKWQGSSSIDYPKKNFTVKFDEAFEAKEGWGAQKKYCLKANFIDHSHARNIISATLWGQIVKNRKMSGGVSGAVSQQKYSVSNKVTVADGEIITKVTCANDGACFFEGVTYPAGTHTITFEVYNPFTAENSGMYSQLACGIPGTENVDFVIKNVNTVEAFGTWLSRSVTVDFPVDGSMIGFNIYSLSEPEDNENPSMGYKFRNIMVDGEPYPLVPSLIRLKDLPNGGAIDGFPCIIMLNGKFQGLYTFNIPKDGWMMGMGDGQREAILCADYSAASRFVEEATLDGDFDVEYAPDEDDVEWIKESVNRLINACRNSDGTDLDTTVAQYLDWESAIDYYILKKVLNGVDLGGKNYILATFDGVKWFFSAYDMDCVYGLDWDGKRYYTALMGTGFSIDEYHTVDRLITTYKTDAMKQRYAALRKGVLSDDNVTTLFTNFVGNIPSTVYAEDARRWPTIPNTATNNLHQIADYYCRRMAAIDKNIEAFDSGE